MLRYSATATLLMVMLFVPLVSNASPYLYTLSTDYSGINGLPAGSTVSWQFEVPSFLTVPTTITSFISASLGAGLSSCGGVLDAQLHPFDAPNPYSSYVITDFTGSCFGGITGAAAFAYGNLNPGVHTERQFSTGNKIGTLTVASVPEPTTLSLLATPLLGAVAARSRRRRVS